MNEIVKDLAEQAKAYAREQMGHTMNAGLFSARVFEDKFAELIVKEMLQTCEDHPAWTGRMIGEQIKQHFGVE